jgi:hypothetical protein
MHLWRGRDYIPSLLLVEAIPIRNVWDSVLIVDLNHLPVASVDLDDASHPACLAERDALYGNGGTYLICLLFSLLLTLNEQVFVA